jgi:rare lipoprotein A
MLEGMTTIPRSRVTAATAAALVSASLVSCFHSEGISREPETPRGGSTSGEIGDGQTKAHAPLDRDEGIATWYGNEFAGRKTASGERFDPSAMTAAHRTLRFGTWVEVTRVDDGRTVRVRITDRGPFGHEGRIIDLSRAAAEKLGIVRAGVAKVKLRIVDGG